MRFKKGSKVEVLSKGEAPPGSWRMAEIICGNGHNYMVRYERYSDTTGEEVVEKVSRKAIRPGPPPVEVSDNWVPGDVVEVFDDFSWKMATIVEVLGDKYLLLRLLGSCLVSKVCKFDIRVRQYWQDNEWIVIGKISRNTEAGNCKEQPVMKHNSNPNTQIQQTKSRMNQCLNDNCITVKSNFNGQEPHIVSSRMLKRRSPYCNSPVEPAGTTKKLKLMLREGRLSQAFTANPSPLPEKVEPIASPQKLPAEKYMHTAFNSRTTGFTEMEVVRGEVSGTVGCSHTASLGPSDSDSFTCSVGSCSITSNTPYKLPRHFYTGPVEDSGNISDAESFCRFGSEEEHCLLPTKEEFAAEIHRLELHAYHCTMEALHASGPLSWEKETLVSNLRLFLNISNDEHLMEVRNLISGDVSIPLS